MADVVVHTRARISAIDRAVGSIPSSLTSNGRVARAMLTRAGLALKGRIHAAFVIKARGGTDEAGDRWAPLSPRTIAYRRAKRSRSEKGREGRPSQALNARQRDRWWDLYRTGLGIFKGNRAAAARRAWSILKREGATTLFAKYHNASVEILRDTGLLLNSLSPSVKSSKYAIFRVGRGEVAVGTNRVGASAHHRGIPGRLPQRRLWPPPPRWPASWWRDILEQVKAGVVEATVQAMRGGR